MNNSRQSKQSMLVRHLDRADSEALIALLADHTLAQSAGLQLMGDGAMQQWAVNNWLTQDDLYGIIINQQLVGLIAIFPYQDGGEVGYFLKPQYQGHQVMTKSLHQVLSHAPFKVIWAEVQVSNIASQRVLLNNNFCEKGRDQDQITYCWSVDETC